MKSAIILGSSGLTGGELLMCLLNQKEYSLVKVFVRKPLSLTHKKLKTIITDFRNLETIKEEVYADAIFSCMGSTRRKTPNLHDYYQVDNAYPLWFARIGKENGVKQFHLVSAVGADSKSKNFYLKLKGTTERDMLLIDIETTCIYRPSMITGKRKEKRFAESAGKYLFKIFDPLLLSNLKKYKSISADCIAQAMLKRSLVSEKGKFIYESHEIKKLAQR